MADQGDLDRKLKRIVLPSGKMIEVVYFENPAAAPSAQPQSNKDRLLHICPACDSKLVYPLQWEEADESHWQVTLRCPNCEHTEEGAFSQDMCDGFDEELERGTDTLTRNYKTLFQANMEEDLAILIKALEVDALLPSDF